MATHTLLVRSYIDGEIKEPGSPVEYDGPPHWKFEPTDRAARARWERQAADPDRVRREHRLMNNGFDSPGAVAPGAGD